MIGREMFLVIEVGGAGWGLVKEVEDEAIFPKIACLCTANKQS